MKTLIKHCTLILNGETEFKGSLLIENSKIHSLYQAEDPLPQADTIVDAQGKILMPGLIDIHLHGSYGYDFIENPQEAIDVVAKGLLKEGTTSFLASLTVISHKELCNLLSDYAKVKQPEKAANYLGIHSEGPYLSNEYKALMDERWLRDPDLQELEEMVNTSKGSIKVMTIAPERKGMDVFIPEAIKQKITLMIGHTGCSCETAEKVLELGATGFTHLYNAMTQHLHRNPGAVTAAILHPEAYTELIVDGFHTHPKTIQATWKMLGPKQIVLITDAMLGKGMPDGDYTFSNLNCRKTGNTVQVKETGRIAGSAITMLDAIANMHRFCGCSMKELVQMACVNPSIIAQVDQCKGTLDPGKDADLILIDQDFNLCKTFVNGEELFSQ